MSLSKIANKIKKEKEAKEALATPKEPKPVKKANVCEDAVGYIPQKTLLEKDFQNLKEIEEFLTVEGFDFHKSEDGLTFTLFHGNPDGKRSYQIKYTPARWFPFHSPKYKIQGVDGKFFGDLSRKAELEENSFICWTKDYEWNDERKREVLKSYWLYAAGLIKTTFYARETEVRVVPTKEAREFESKHCFYGKRGASLNLGLYSKKDKGPIKAGDLIMIYTFGLPFLSGKNHQDGKAEILRVGTYRRCNVAGGASKLLRHFVKYFENMSMGGVERKITDLIFFSDYDHNIGSKSMTQLDFDFVGYSGGGFMNLWFPGTDKEVVKGREPAKHKEIMEKTRHGELFAVPNAGVKTYNLNVAKFKAEHGLE